MASKARFNEGGVRVPTIVRWPEHVAAGSSSDYVSGFEDWMPTLLTALGLADRAPPAGDGVNIVPTLEGQEQPQRPFMYREFTGYGGQQSIRVGDWKAVRMDTQEGNLELELYNLAQDANEKNNVASQHPEIVDRLRRLLEKEHTRSAIQTLGPFDKK